MLTLLIYLAEEQEGGATRFPDLGLDVEPRRGDAIFFRNVHTPLLDDEPYAMRTHFDAAHAGEPVTRGTKHILTKWFHPVPYPDGPPESRTTTTPPGRRNHKQEGSMGIPSLGARTLPT